LTFTWGDCDAEFPEDGSCALAAQIETAANKHKLKMGLGFLGTREF